MLNCTGPCQGGATSCCQVGPQGEPRAVWRNESGLSNDACIFFRTSAPSPSSPVSRTVPPLRGRLPLLPLTQAVRTSAWRKRRKRKERSRNAAARRQAAQRRRTRRSPTLTSSWRPSRESRCGGTAPSGNRAGSPRRRSSSSAREPTRRWGTARPGAGSTSSTRSFLSKKRGQSWRGNFGTCNANFATSLL